MKNIKIRLQYYTVFIEKNPDISGPKQFKPTLFAVYIPTNIYTPPHPSGSASLENPDKYAIAAPLATSARRPACDLAAYTRLAAVRFSTSWHLCASHPCPTRTVNLTPEFPPESTSHSSGQTAG